MASSAGSKIAIKNGAGMSCPTSRLFLLVGALCFISPLNGCVVQPDGPKQPGEVVAQEVPRETDTVPLSSSHHRTTIAPTYPSQKSNSQPMGAHVGGKTAGSGSGSGTASGSSSGSGSGSGTASGSSAGNGSGSGTASGSSAGNGSGSGTASGSSSGSGSGSRTASGSSSGSGSGSGAAGAKQSTAKGEVDGAGKATGKSAKEFFSETSPPTSATSGSTTTAPGNQPATTPSKELDFSKVVPTDAPLPNSKPLKNTGDGAAKLVLPFRGCWRQIDCNLFNTADFSLGGYSQRYLIFNEGQGEMRVYCGFGESAKQRIAIRYRFISKGDGLLSIEPASSAAAALELIPNGASPPTSLTATVRWSLSPDGTVMVLSGKQYRRVSGSEGQAFATGEKMTNMPVAAAKSTPTLFALPWIGGDTLIIFDSGQSAESRSNALSALRTAFREQLQGRRALLISLNSELPLTWAAAGTSLLMKQVATAESSAAQPLTTSHLSDLFRNVPSPPARILIIIGGSLRPSDITDLMQKCTWTCPVDVVVAGSAVSDEWRKLASATGGKVAP